MDPSSERLAYTVVRHADTVREYAILLCRHNGRSSAMNTAGRANPINTSLKS